VVTVVAVDPGIDGERLGGLRIGDDGAGRPDPPPRAPVVPGQ